MKDKMEKMMQTMDQKTPSKPSRKDIQAKKEVLMELLGECDAELKGRAGRGLDSSRQMKVSVSADSPSDLKEGLEKAEELTEELPEDMLSGLDKNVNADAMDNAVTEDILEEALEGDRKPADVSAEEDEDASFFQKKRKKDRDF